ncbi:mechanosensitive ion channel [Kineococcus sp. T13]|uniref:mechanosensitive ion channel domain-containing protein n=1 Tax=Kineococcus vitellinus TaxID=2696565 RepID=UPI00141318D3|nr:mechanosensitive ion channel [Kineococcus vitellinus]
MLDPITDALSTVSTDEATDGAGAVLRFLLDKPLKVLVVLLVCFVARFLLLRLIGRVATGIATGAGKLGGGRRNGLLESSPLLSERRQQRAETLASVLKSTVTFVVGVLAVLVVLDTVGISIGPFLASAGIAGVALGFGAQALVKDFLSGFFMLAEDQYGVGDVVDLGDASGTVEAVGLRVTRLRDVKGTVWYVRNGEILRVGNQSQGWARAVVDVAVAYGEDLTRAQEVLLRVAEQLAGEEEWSELVIDAPEVWGVEQMAADGIVLRVVVKTAPLQQWAVQRELNRRIKGAFDAEGIEFPFPQRTVWLRNDDERRPQHRPAGSPTAGVDPQPPPRSEADVAVADAAAADAHNPHRGL